MKPFLILDFCGTCISYQTGDLFLLTLIKRRGSLWAKCVSMLLSSRVPLRLIRLLKPDFKLYEALIALTQGIPAHLIKSFSIEYAAALRNDLDPAILSILVCAYEKGYNVIIASAGYFEYLQYVFSFLGRVDIVASRLKYEQNKSSGRLDGSYCYGSAKADAVRLRYNDIIDPCLSMVCSDCFSDMPLFSLVKSKRWFVHISKNSNTTTLSLLQNLS